MLFDLIVRTVQPSNCRPTGANPTVNANLAAVCDVFGVDKPRTGRVNLVLP
jgi:hypothetical protein